MRDPKIGLERIDTGSGGKSARARGDQELLDQLASRAALKEAHPVLGRLSVALSGPATDGGSWRKGAVGEEKFGAALDSMRDDGVIALHDRQIPRSAANIDHIVVASSGVWVVDTKRYTGKVAVIDKGGWFTTNLRLVVNGPT